MSNDKLIFQKTLRDGRVLALNVWATGQQPLVYTDQAAFDHAKVEVEQNGVIPLVGGFVPAD